MKAENILFFTMPVVLSSVNFLNKLSKGASTNISTENPNKHAILQILPEQEWNFI